MTEKVTGPASYFPSIEKRYGHPIDWWFEQLEPHKGMRHMEMVEFLKSEHGMGHGHAQAIVHVFRSRNGLQGTDTSPAPVTRRTGRG